MKIGYQAAILAAAFLWSGQLQARQEDQKTKKDGTPVYSEQKEGSTYRWFADPNRGWIKADERRPTQSKDREKPRKQDRQKDKDS